MPSFAVTGVDFVGPLHMQENHGEIKAYICCFTHVVTRAVHLKVVPDLSAASFKPFTDLQAASHCQL